MSNHLQVIEGPIKSIRSFVVPGFRELFGAEAESKLSQELNFLQSHMITSLGNSSNTKIHHCTPESIAGLMRDVVSLGLTLNPAMKQVYIVPRRNKALNVVNATMMVSYQGEIDYLHRNGVIIKADVSVIREKDVFEYRNTNQGFEYIHTKSMKESRIIGAYCCYHLPSGLTHGNVFRDDEIRLREAKAQSPKFWNAWRERMVEKTAVRMARQGLPMNESIALLNEIDNQHFVVDYELTEEEKLKIETNVKGAESIPALMAVYQGLSPARKQDEVVMGMFTERKKELKEVKAIEE